MSSTDHTSPDIGRIPQLGDPHPNALPPHFRAETARAFLAALIANPESSGTVDGFVKEALQYTDALIAALTTPKEPHP